MWLGFIVGNHSNMKNYTPNIFLKKIDKEWEELDERKRNKIITFLKKLGYCDKVIIDEYQAYRYTEKDNFFGVKLWFKFF